jgi:hypothetical protein
MRCFLIARRRMSCSSIPLSMAMLFATPLIVFNDADVGAALKASFGACLKNISPFLV